MILDELISNAATTLALILGISFPIIRYKCRKRHNLIPYFKYDALMHDIASGCMLPFLALVLLSTIITEIKPDKHAIMMAAGYAIAMSLVDLFKDVLYTQSVEVTKLESNKDIT